jgi:hypothetical protein
MQYVEVLFLINSGACAIALGSGMLLGYLLFKSLKKNHVTYYKSIGEPIIIAPINFTEDNYIQLLKGGVFAYSIVFKGIPKNFPKDIGLRKLAQAVRIVLTIVLILFIALLISGYFFYKSGL